MKECWPRDRMSRYFYPSDSISIAWRSFSPRKLTTGSWVSARPTPRSPMNLLLTFSPLSSSTVAPGGDHLISLIDEISYVSPPAPMISQIDDIPPEQFCNGDNRPADCGPNCMCTHKVDIPLNAVVEVVLVDEGEYRHTLQSEYKSPSEPSSSPTGESEPSFPSAWLCVQCHWHGTFAGHECEEDQFEACPRLGSPWLTPS